MVVDDVDVVVVVAGNVVVELSGTSPYGTVGPAVPTRVLMWRSLWVLSYILA